MTAEELETALSTYTQMSEILFTIAEAYEPDGCSITLQFWTDSTAWVGITLHPWGSPKGENYRLIVVSKEFLLTPIEQLAEAIREQQAIGWPCALIYEAVVPSND